MAAPDDLTSFHVGRAKSGDAESLSWVVDRFTPLLRAHARYRIGKTLQSRYDPEDLVHEVWAIALPRLPDLPPRDARNTPVVLRFLTTTLFNLLRGLVRKESRGRADGIQESTDEIAEARSGVVTKIARDERSGTLHAAIEQLEPRDREILVLRGIEQNPYNQIAAILGEDAKILAVRYGRVLTKLKKLLPGSVVDELVDE